MTSYNTLDFDVNNSIATITLNRPDAANGLNPEMGEELFKVALQCDESPDIRAVILTGAGKMFCAGGDLKTFAAAGDNISSVIKQSATLLHTSISRFARMDTPMIAAVNGTAAGAGFSMAIMADFVICAEKAKFTMAYTGAGLSPDGSSSYFLPRLIGLRKAQELMITNKLLTAQDALEWGLVNKVVPNESLLDEANALATTLANGPTLSYGKVKQLLYSSFENGLETQMELETQCITESSKTADGKEGIQAFLDKRKPEFTGR